MHNKRKKAVNKKYRKFLFYVNTDVRYRIRNTNGASILSSKETLKSDVYFKLDLENIGKLSNYTDSFVVVLPKGWSLPSFKDRVINCDSLRIINLLKIKRILNRPYEYSTNIRKSF